MKKWVHEDYGYAAAVLPAHLHTHGQGKNVCRARACHTPVRYLAVGDTHTTSIILLSPPVGANAGFVSAQSCDLHLRLRVSGCKNRSRKGISE